MNENPYMENHKIVKVLLIGNAGVGKTTLVLKKQNGDYNEMPGSTIGVNICRFAYSLGNDQTIELQIYDTAGQEVYRSVSLFYFRDADYALICFDPLQEDWKESLFSWTESLNEKTNSCMVTYVATKADLWGKNQEYFNEIMKYIPDTYNTDDICVTSSLTGYNVDYLFDHVAQRCSSDSFVPQPIPTPEVIKVNTTESKANQCAC